MPGPLIEAYELPPNLWGFGHGYLSFERQSGTALGIPAFAKFVTAITYDYWHDCYACRVT